MKQKEQINITIEDLDDIQKVLKSLEFLFQKLVLYYTDKDMEKLSTLILSCSVWFGKMLKLLGYTEEDFGEQK